MEPNETEVIIHYSTVEAIWEAIDQYDTHQNWVLKLENYPMTFIWKAPTMIFHVGDRVRITITKEPKPDAQPVQPPL